MLTFSEKLIVVLLTLTGIAVISFAIWWRVNNDKRIKETYKECVSMQVHNFSKLYKNPLRIVRETEIYCKGKKRENEN